MSTNEKEVGSTLRRFPNGHSYNYTEKTKKRINEWIKTYVDHLSLSTAIGTKNVIKALAAPDSISGYFKRLIERDTRERIRNGTLSKEKAGTIVAAYQKELEEKKIEGREDPAIVKILKDYSEGSFCHDRTGDSDTYL